VPFCQRYNAVFHFYFIIIFILFKKEFAIPIDIF